MSVNLDVSFEIHNITAIHNEATDDKRQAVIKAAEDFLKEEYLYDQDFVVDFLGQEGYLAAYSTFPIIISRSYKWVPEVTERWQSVAKVLIVDGVLEATCQSKVNVDYPDEEY